MVKPDKKNKREYERKKKAEELTKPEIERRRKQTDESRKQTVDRPEKPESSSAPNPSGAKQSDAYMTFKDYDFKPDLLIVYFLDTNRSTATFNF